MAKVNPFRFSTKYQDDDTDLLYYGKRYLNWSTGRWLSRDPKEEMGGRNLYCFVGNNSLSRIDVLGEADFVWDAPPKEKDGKMPGRPGFVDWDPFAPEAEVYSTGGCCFHVRLSGGHARAFVFYNQGELWGNNIRAHEFYHVTEHMKPAYTDYKTAANNLGTPCMRRRRAECIRAVILDKLKEEYKTRSYRDGTKYDWYSYGSGADLETQADSWKRMTISAEQYAAAKAATTAAIAACPAGWEE
jgi:RHS repeat-associated protein